VVEASVGRSAEKTVGRDFRGPSEQLMINGNDENKHLSFQDKINTINFFFHLILFFSGTRHIKYIILLFLIQAGLRRMQK
jgi:hypothetical protein